MGWLVLFACGMTLFAPVGLSAQSGDNTRTYYLPARSFDIPFSIPQNDPGTEEILNYSTDGQPYRYYASARPIDRRFHFTAPKDGWYSFIVQTRDASGALTPENLRGVPPNIRVCVDTQNPVIESFTADEPSDNALPTIRWKIAEANLKEVLADYRSTDSGVWVPLFLPAKEEGAHPWKPTYLGELEVRLMAVDKAERRSEVRTLRLRVANNVSRMPPPQDPAGAGKVLFVKHKTFQLNYTLDHETVGPSKVDSVDIWKLHPGQGWRKCPEKGKSIGPATVSVESSGRWGFRLIPVSGVGLKERDPQPGDAPDIWVEVDDKAPLVRVTNVTVTPEADGGYLTVYWKADDAFLHPMPISIFMASPPQGADWFPVAKDLPNNGHWRYKIDDLKQQLGDRYEFALKVVAIDEAGNLGDNQWRDTVKTDLRVPRIKHVEINANGSAAGGQHSYGAAGTPPMGSFSFDSQPAPKPGPSPINASGAGFNSPRK